MKNFLRCGLFLAAAAVSLLAADPTGKWSASMPGRGGQTMTQTFDLKADGDKLSGTVAGRMGETDISEGKVEGDNISFAVVREFNGNSIKILYKGVIDGDTIHFTMSREGGNGNGPGGGERKFDAKKQQ